MDAKIETQRGVFATPKQNGAGAGVEIEAEVEGREAEAEIGEKEIGREGVGANQEIGVGANQEIKAGAGANRKKEKEVAMAVAAELQQQWTPQKLVILVA